MSPVLKKGTCSFLAQEDPPWLLQQSLFELLFEGSITAFCWGDRLSVSSSPLLSLCAQDSSAAKMSPLDRSWGSPAVAQLHN